MAEEHAGKIEEKHRDGHASSSDSEDERSTAKSAESSHKDKLRRLFGRERPVYDVLGGGKSPPCIPEVLIPEEPVLKIARNLSYEINRAFTVLREIALGRNLKKFLVVIAGLWILSVVGSLADLLTLFYILFVILHTMPVLYEKYDDKVDTFAEKVVEEIKKHYAAVDAMLITMIHRGSPKKKKQQ